MVWVASAIAQGLAPASAVAQDAGRGRGEAGAARRPPLIVLIVVDQMRGDCLDRYATHLSPDGFMRLLREGAYFPNAYYSHGTTTTGPGHACIATGANPRVHGIAANADPRGQCCDDDAAPLLGSDGPAKAGASPRRLLVPTLGDMIKLSTGGRGKVVSVGLKDRAVVLLGGHAPDRAVWWDHKTGRFVTSRYYGDALPSWAEELNKAAYANSYFGKRWERALPAAAYSQCAPDDDPSEADPFGLGRMFPHPLTGGQSSPDKHFYSALWATPAGDEMAFELARRAIEYEKLGADDAVDLLCLALSSYDVCGHLFGPDSQEILDMTVRLDRQLAQFLKRLDDVVGAGRCLLALTSDHGVAPCAARARALRLDAGTFREKDVEDRLNAALRRTFGISDDKTRLVAGIEMPWLHLDQKVMERARVSSDRVVAACMLELRQIEGVGWVYPASVLAGDAPPVDDDFARMAWAAYHPQLAGQIYIGLRPYWHKLKADQAASHGTFHGYDRHVPIVLYGPGIRPGRYQAPADPIDIAKSICLHIGVEPAATMTGRMLHECTDSIAAR